MANSDSLLGLEARARLGVVMHHVGGVDAPERAPGQRFDRASAPSPDLARISLAMALPRQRKCESVPVKRCHANGEVSDLPEPDRTSLDDDEY
jgi:hypothetical protein